MSGSGNNCVIEIPAPDLMWIPVFTSTPIITPKIDHDQKNTSGGASVNESSHHASQLLEVPSRLDSGIGMSIGENASISSSGTHRVSVISSPSFSSFADSAYSSPSRVAYGFNALWNAQNNDFWPRPLRENVTPARLPERPSDMSEPLKNAVFSLLLILMIVGFMIFTICTAKNSTLMITSLSLGMIVLFFTVHQFRNKVVVSCTRPRPNIPLVVYNRPNIPRIV